MTMKPENKTASPFKAPENYFENFKVTIPKDLRTLDNRKYFSSTLFRSFEINNTVTTLVTTTSM